MQFKEYRVERAPPSAFYIPDFITVEEEQHLIHQVYAAPKPKWKELSHRRLQNWGGLPHPRGMVAEHIPAWLQQHMDSIAELGAFGDKRPNHVLVNEYLAGQGIMPHVDGPMFYPTITTISLSGHTLLDLYTPRPPDDMQEEMTSKEQDNSEDSHTSAPSAFENRYVGSLFLAPRSLLILQDDIYTTYLHGIAEVGEDVVSRDVLNLPSIPHTPGDTMQRDTRISLTIRHVPKVLKNKVWLGGSRR
uniref:Fe2OG dioxygenase domain-containing protein n=1 Tax=Scylla olivacea TaxID=85551 RepID=A0A0P4W1U2_SCYOL